jgi:hypothetical protein
MVSVHVRWLILLGSVWMLVEKGKGVII